MTWIDRLLGRRKHSSSFTLTLHDRDSAPPPKPQSFCTHCGQPMVDGYVIFGRAFDGDTGQPNLKVRRGRMCFALHQYEWPGYKTDADGEVVHDPMTDHDGFPRDSYFSPWGWEQYDYIPDCTPRKAVKR